MEATRPGFFARLWMAIWVPWKLLFNPDFAAGIVQVRALPPPEPAALPPPAPREADPAPALHLLAVLQREGRLVDFLQEPIATFSDAEVGAAARVVHEGCRRAIAEWFTLEPVRAEGEGAALTVPPGFDASEIRLTGRVVGAPPFKGRLAHPGWKAVQVKLPELMPGWNDRVIAPAEVELP